MSDVNAMSDSHELIYSKPLMVYKFVIFCAFFSSTKGYQQFCQHVYSLKRAK